MDKPPQIKKTHLDGITIEGTSFDRITAIQDSDGVILILPLLFSAYMDAQGETHSLTRIEGMGETAKELRSNLIAPKTADNYMNYLFRFISWIDQMHNNSNGHEAEYPDVHNLQNVTERIIGDYLNTELPKTLSRSSLNGHTSALHAFYNFLTYIKVRNPAVFNVSRKARKAASKNESDNFYSQYVTSRERFELEKQCRSLRDKLILKMGSEVGLRSAENCGIYLRGNLKNNSLLKLFDELDEADKRNKHQFEYRLKAFTKGDVPRFIYFDKPLLRAMRRYYLTERAEILEQVGLTNETGPDTFFLNDDNRFKGQPISPGCASTRFRTYADNLPYLDESLVYHDLRHTFATELYHQELLDQRGNETRSESAALLTVAIRLGHALTKDGKPSKTTRRYIRLREVMLSLEEDYYGR